MANLMLLGLIILSIITLGTFGAMAAGYQPDFFEGGHMAPSNGRGGCDRFDDENQDNYRGRCGGSGEYDCAGPNSEECEEYCEENGYNPDDCPRGSEDCPNSGPCY